MVANRLRVTIIAALALLNVVTLGAGAAVANLLPARLALWQVARVAQAPLARQQPALAPAAPHAAPPDGRGLAAALGKLAGAPALGKHVGIAVTDIGSGSVLYSRGGGSPAVPASSQKLVTAAAALAALGPSARFTTRVVRGQGDSLILAGGGDPTLAAGHPPASDYPRPATLASLATATARWLRSRHQTTVRLGYDGSRFTGPAMAPGWTGSYITTGNVTPISALEVDQGRLTGSGKPQDADIPGNFRARSTTPAADAARSFSALLTADGITVTGPPAPARPPAGAARVAAVRSPELAAIVAWMLRESNNVIAEDLARQVALRRHYPASFSGGAAAVTAQLRRLGVTSGLHLVDGSGLSPRNRIAPDALARVITMAAQPARPGRSGLRPIIAGLPVAGFSGTLAPGQSLFGGFGPAALGMVRAKTGNLTTVASLTGVAVARSGELLGFAFMADKIPSGGLGSATTALDRLATALAGCGCS
ncbi:MAG TPA: D-alanyl-D-alanine carboxypeptidase/D-alanyl-D-alanine-endopeptidase [Streptosporangiaceae bacterium]|nr:D-alanyl-D-alanine carboxypeptidase/D-alanyl-D-alanine-endopeptidase [Streptosporangiaceae bacterium]